MTDLFFIIQWWFLIFVIGLIFLPFTKAIFSNFYDKGYIFSKIIGITILSYSIFLLSSLKLLKFNQVNSLIIFVILAIIILFFSKVFDQKRRNNLLKILKENFTIIVIEEFLFILTLAFWSYIKGFQPNIYGLEKYMDFGFINSILRSDYFPPSDMWFTPLPINYYYFGHLITAVLTKISGIPSFITYNLMLATLFAFVFTETFSIGANLLQKLNAKRYTLYAISGLLSAFLVTFAGNFHTIYTFFKPYLNESPLPFWQLIFSWNTFPNSYWYPNATRFIYHTIHEFPIYSFVVSDLHGHVLDIPIVLLTIAILFSLILNFKNSFQILNFKFQILVISFSLAVMYMTNVWDGIIYLILTIFVLIFLKILSKENFYNLFIALLLIIAGFLLFSLPFMFNFKPFASGIGILCAPDFLITIGKIGPFLFEKDHCQRSLIWQLTLLYGFFYFWIIIFFLILIKKKNHKLQAANHKQIQNPNLQKPKHFLNLNFENWNLFGIWNLEFGILSVADLFVLLLIFLSTILIIIPEFIYIKDIYPAHYRANTMFKLVYQSFIMLSISSGYIIIKMINEKRSCVRFISLFIGSLGLFLVMIYPYFAINSYFEELKHYQTLDGLAYLKKIYFSDYEAIMWLNKSIKGQPVILEAQGDSYTDYARVSANTGLPTVLGWTVHEWLWRGTYDIPALRIIDVQKLYETNDLAETKKLIDKYKIKLVFIGTLERQKYKKLNEEKFNVLGTIIYKNKETEVYKINN